MKKSELSRMNHTWILTDKQNQKVRGIINHLESRIGGKKGAEASRDRLAAGIEKAADFLYGLRKKSRYFTPAESHKIRHERWARAQAKSLALKAMTNFDEHGKAYRWSDSFELYGVDFVSPRETATAPYWDMGGEGLGLVYVSRTRTYSKSSRWSPSSVATYFLVGRNEAWTYFSHPVSPNVRTVEEACQWIWGGKAYQIIQRQGDIALIGGNGGPKMPPYLPLGHNIEGDKIVHRTHPDLPMPKNPGERIIVGRRAAERASAATRD